MFFRGFGDFGFRDTFFRFYFGFYVVCFFRGRVFSFFVGTFVIV